MFEQERMIGRLQRRIVDEPEIIASFLAGSYGRRAEDDFSDLDVALVYANDQSRERAWQNRVQFAKSIMPYISIKSFDGSHVRPYFHIVLFANGSKVDLRFETKDLLKPNPWDSQIRILKDSDDWLGDFQAQSSRLALPQSHMSGHELSKLDQRFWVMYWDVLRLLARGDTEKSFPIYLELLHFSLPPLMEALPSESSARLNLIEATFSKDTKVTRTHMRELLKSYTIARKAIVDRYHLQFTGDHSFENQIQRLVDKLT